MRSLRLVLSTAAVFASHIAHAALLLNDDFSGDHPGLSLTSLSNFKVSGSVDVILSDDPQNPGTLKNIVDLSGTSAPGTITTTSFPTYADGEVALVILLGGSQRSNAREEFHLGFTFDLPTTITRYTLQGGFGRSANLGNFTTSAIETSSSISSMAEFMPYAVSFRTTTAGMVTANIGTTSVGNSGPFVSRVDFGSGPLPEPAAWLMMVSGFGGIGLVLRRARILLQ